MASGLPGAVLRRRLRGKQRGTATPVGGEVLPTAGADAIAWERALGLGSLGVGFGSVCVCSGLGSV